MRPTTRLYKNLSVSINLGDEITLKTLSDAQKSLYCPVCYLYDCGKHQSEERCI